MSVKGQAFANVLNRLSAFPVPDVPSLTFLMYR